MVLLGREGFESRRRDDFGIAMFGKVVFGSSGNYSRYYILKEFISSQMHDTKSNSFFNISRSHQTSHYSPPAQSRLSRPHPSHPAPAHPHCPAPIQKRRRSPRCGSWCRFSATAPSLSVTTSGSGSARASCCICARARRGWRFETFGCAREGSRLPQRWNESGSRILFYVVATRGEAARRISWVWIMDSRMNGQGDFCESELNGRGNRA